MRFLHVVSLSFLFSSTAACQPYTISTFAGGGLPASVPGTSASIGEVDAVAVDTGGNVFIASQTLNAVLRLDAHTGVLTVAAGNGSGGFSGDNGPATSAQLFHPSGVALDSAGNLYIADYTNQIIRKVTSGVITTVAGTGAAGFGGDGGPAANARLNFPSGVASDSAGNVYIADTGNNRIRKISGGMITTVAGNGVPGLSGDGGSATSASLNNPSGVAVDSAGNLSIADLGNSRIRRVSNSVITTVAGNGMQGFAGDNGSATNARLFDPSGVAVDSAGNLYIAESENSRIRKVSNGVITTVAGNGTFGSAGDSGPAVSGALNAPVGVAVDTVGNLYIADEGNYRVRKVFNGVITTVAGNGSDGYSGDGGPASNAQLNSPTAVALDPSGNSLYVSDSVNHCVRRVSNGVITTVAGPCAPYSLRLNGPFPNSQIIYPASIAVDSAGNLYIADALNNRIRRVSNGVVTTVAGNGTPGFSGDNGLAVNAEVNNPAGVAVDSAGNLYIADSGNGRIRKVSAGVITTVAGNGTQGFNGDNGPALNAQLNGPGAVALDGAGNLYIADTAGNRIRKVSNGVITTVAGNGSAGFSGDNGAATGAQLFQPTGIALDGAGNLYIADYRNNRVRKVSGGMITSIAGNGELGFIGENSPGTGASLSGPNGVTVDSAGRVYIADVGNNRVRVLTPTACAYSVMPASLQIPAAGGSFVFTIQSSTGCAWMISGLPSWITLSGSPSGAGSQNVTLFVAANTSAIQRGVILSVAGLSIPVAQQASSSVFLRAVQSAASYASGEIAPGEIVVLSGSGMGPTELTQFQVDSRGYIPAQLATTQVLFNGVPAPILYTRADVVAAIVPYEVSGNSASIVVQYQGQSSLPLSVPVVATIPGVFTAAANGSGQAAAINEDGSFNAANTPAKAGSVITLYATGEGLTSPPGVNGRPAGVPLPKPLQSVSVTVDGLPAEVVYAGGAPTEVAGVMQVNVRIPAMVPSDDAVAIVVYVGDGPSQTGVTIAVLGN